MINKSVTYKNDIKISLTRYQNLEKLSGKSVLITGAGGLICSAVIDLLMQMNIEKNAGIRVFAAARNEKKLEKRFPAYLSHPMFSIIKYDALKPFSSEDKYDYIIHGASNANPAAYVKEPVETMLANFTGMNYILEQAKKDGSRVLYISSSEVYGNKTDTAPYMENCYYHVDLLTARACYPSSKRAAETLCAAYAEEYGVESVIVRPGHIYGPTALPSDNRASSQFPRDVMEGHDIIMKSAGEQIRSYCYVVDCAAAILFVLTEGNAGEAYNISNSDSIASIREMAEAFAEAGNTKVVFEKPSDQEKKGYNMMNNSSLNSSKLEGLGWKGYFNLKAGTEHTLQALREIEHDEQK